MGDDIRELAGRHCRPCEGKTPPLAGGDADRYLARLAGWERREGEIRKSFAFRNFHETMAFANAVAWIAHREDHHPDLEVSYRTCIVRYTTHAIGGLSDNDFISAAKVEELFS